MTEHQVNSSLTEAGRKDPWAMHSSARRTVRWYALPQGITTKTISSANRGSTDYNGIAYWKANLRLIYICMAIWFVVSYGFGILLRPVLDAIPVGGVGLGFWFAQQGSMYVFLALVFFYASQMNKLDRQFNVHED